MLSKECHHKHKYKSAHTNYVVPGSMTSVRTTYLDVVPTASQWEGKNKLLLPLYSRKRKKSIRMTESHQMFI